MAGAGAAWSSFKEHFFWSHQDRQIDLVENNIWETEGQTMTHKTQAFLPASSVYYLLRERANGPGRTDRYSERRNEKTTQWQNYQVFATDVGNENSPWGVCLSAMFLLLWSQVPLLQQFQANICTLFILYWAKYIIRMRCTTLLCLLRLGSVLSTEKRKKWLGLFSFSVLSKFLATYVF